jgi:hypothetical protein
MIDPPAFMCGTAAWQVLNVDIERADPFLVGDFFQAFMGHLERSVIDEDVDAPEARHGLIDDLAALRLVGEVARQQQALASGLFDPTRGFLGVFMLVQVRDSHVRAFTGEGNRHGAADAAVGAGDQGDLVCQASGAFVALFAAVWIRLHFPLAAGHRLALFGKGWGWIIGHIVLHGEWLRWRVDCGVSSGVRLDFPASR